ncbi:MAG: hypothetical protein Q7U84_05550 [Polynucleobacter sp.]|nr:hypothetical protein [Polynucleobacter sp.]
MKLPTVAQVIDVVRFFRPEFYNKATWLLLIAGIALTSTSITERILFAFLDMQFNLKLTESSDSYIGLALVILGLSYNLAGQTLRLRHEVALTASACSTEATERKAHDIAILENLFEELPYESVSPIINNASMAGVSIAVCELISAIAHTHNSPPYELHNQVIEEKRRLLVSTCASFYEAMLQFLGHESGYPENMVVPPYSLKSQNRDAFYSMQHNVSKSGLAFLAAYEDLIRICKSENYYRVKNA